MFSSLRQKKDVLFASEIVISEMAVSDICIDLLKQKAEEMLQATGAFMDYEITYKGLSIEEM